MFGKGGSNLMKCLEIMLKVKLPDNFSESETDEALADALIKLGGTVAESNYFLELCN